MTQNNKPISATERQTLLLKLALDYATEKHAGQTFDFYEGDYIEHPMAVAKEMPTVYSKMVMLLHDVVENLFVEHKNIQQALGNKLTSLDEEVFVRKELKKIADEFARYGFFGETVIEPNRNINNLVEDLNFLSFRRLQYDGEAAKPGAYMAYLEESETYQKYIRQFGAQYINKLHEYMNSIETLADHAENVRRPELLSGKLGDIDHNHRADRNIQFLPTDMSEKAVKTAARLMRYEIAAEYLKAREIEIIIANQHHHTDNVFYMPQRTDPRVSYPYTQAANG